jgi:hypothetical protein
MNPTKQQRSAALREAYKLKATGPSPTADLEQYVAVIAQAVMDNEAWDRGLVVDMLRTYAASIKAADVELYHYIPSIEEQADLMEGRGGG